MPAWRSLAARVAALLLAALILAGLADQRPAFAQDAYAAIDPEAMKVLVAPVALYPDDVLAVVLPASTTGLQVVQAQRFLDQRKTNPSLQPGADWDPSILALLNYPDVVARLNADLDWTQRLGDAVVNQQADVMEAIQQIRNEAVASGYLRSDGKVVVTQQQQTVVIQSANPQVVYVPNYDPQVVIQQTYISAPPPVYYNPYPAYYSPAATFVTGLAVGGALAYAFDWIHHDIDVDVHYHDDGHHDNDHHDNDHHDNNDHHNNNNNGHYGNNGNRDLGRYNIDRKPGEAGNKFTWNAKDKRPAARPADVNRPAGLAPATRPPARNNNFAPKPATPRPAPPKPASPKPANNSQVQNRIGGAQATGKPAGGFGNITPSRTTQLQQQRGTQSRQQQKAPPKPAVSQSKARAPQQFRSPAGGGAFGGSANSGRAVKAQQQRGGGSRGQQLMRR